MKQQHRYLVLLLLLLAGWHLPASAQPPHRYRHLGGIGNEEIREFVPMPSGDFLAVGYVEAEGYVQGTAARKDALAMRMTAEGEVVWAASYGGDRDEEFIDVAYYQGFYYCLGSTRSWSADSTLDMLLVKIDGSNGAVRWSKRIARPSGRNDTPIAIIETQNLGIMIVGNIQLDSGFNDFLVARALPNGDIVLAVQYDLYDNNTAKDIIGLNAEQFVIAGEVGPDNLIMKIDQNGYVFWARALDLSIAADGGSTQSIIVDREKSRLIVTATSGENVGSKVAIAYDISAQTGEQVIPSMDPRMTKYAHGSNNIHNRQIRGYLIPKNRNGCGYYFAPRASETTSLDTTDAVIMGLDTAFNIQWQRSFGGQKFDYIRRLRDCCVGNEIIGMGGTRSTSSGEDFDILYSSLLPTGNFDFTDTDSTCTETPVFSPIPVTYTNSYSGVSSYYIGSDWFLDQPLGFINTLPEYLQVRSTFCGPILSSISGPGPISGFISAEQISETEIKIKPENLNTDVFHFDFTITNIKEEELFHTDNMELFIKGILVPIELRFPPGEYFWKYDAIMKNGQAVIKLGSFVVE